MLPTHFMFYSVNPLTLISYNRRITFLASKLVPQDIKQASKSIEKKLRTSNFYVTEHVSKTYKDYLTHKLGYGNPCRSTITGTMIRPKESQSLTSEHQNPKKSTNIINEFFKCPQNLYP